MSPGADRDKPKCRPEAQRSMQKDLDLMMEVNRDETIHVAKVLRIVEMHSKDAKGYNDAAKVEI